MNSPDLKLYSFGIFGWFSDFRSVLSVFVAFQASEMVPNCLYLWKVSIPARKQFSDAIFQWISLKNPIWDYLRSIRSIMMILMIFSNFSMNPAIVRPPGACCKCQHSFCIIPGTGLENSQYRFLIFCLTSVIRSWFCHVKSEIPPNPPSPLCWHLYMSIFRILPIKTIMDFRAETKYQKSVLRVF